MIWFLHWAWSNNIGDQACGPYLYFDFPGWESRVLSFAWKQDANSFLHFDSSGVFLCVIGGGGLVPTMSVFERAMKNFPRSVIWGIGFHQDSDIFDRSRYSRSIAKALRVGMRDFFGIWPYVPCVSCMHPALSWEALPEHELVVYESQVFRVDTPLLSGAPKDDNFGAPLNAQPGSREQRELLDARMRHVIEFLLSGKTVVTRSWHGAFWSMLLGRRTIVYKPWSSKFMLMPPEVEIAYTESDLKRLLDIGYGPVPRRRLRDSRRINRAFYSSICEEILQT